MSPEDPLAEWVAGEKDVDRLLERARDRAARDDLERAATIYDRAYGLAPAHAAVRDERAALLDRLALEEHGLTFRYVPGGPFRMGDGAGEADERPEHEVWLSPYWMSAHPVSWDDFCRLMDWEPPPASCPRVKPAPTERDFHGASFHLREQNKVRLQYCEDHTLVAGDWHAHDPGQMWQSGGRAVPASEIFGEVPRADKVAAHRYGRKPMVAVAWQDAAALATRLSGVTVRHALPTEAQWEKAARGGLVGARYSWGNDRPTPQNCDFDRFGAFSIRPTGELPPNGYGLFATCGSIWEWTSDWYDRDYYASSPRQDPAGPASGEHKVLRGGSWADCEEAVTVSFRMSRPSSSWTGAKWDGHLTPNVGFRLCRRIVETG